MSYYLFLDDIRVPSDVTWVDLPKADYEIVRSYKEFVDIFRNKGFPLFISFDHDLADEHYASTGYMGEQHSEKTGYDCAKWLAQYCYETNLAVPKFMVHSMNPVGKKNIEQYLNNFIARESRNPYVDRSRVLP